MTPRPYDLRVEHLDEPLGIDVGRPRLSWKLPPGSSRQHGFRIRAGSWDSGRVDSDASVLVPYGGDELASGQRVTWSVKVWTDLGESEWSDESWWEMGLLDSADWLADWIEAREQPETDDGRAAAQLFRREVRVDRPVVSARLYATARGIYELFLDGQRVGDMELTPGYTSYSSILQVQTYDVSDLVAPGELTWDAVVSEGWYRGQNGYFRRSHVYGDRLALRGQLHLRHADGSTTVVATGADWLTSTGPLRAGDLMQGVCADPGWAPAEWRPVVLGAGGGERLCASPSPPVRRIERLEAVAITEPRPGRHVVDFGQNVNGWVRLGPVGSRGSKLVLTHGETTDVTGDVTLENVAVPRAGLGPVEGLWDLRNLELPFQTDELTSDGVNGFEPRHTTHGFRYVRVEGVDELASDDVAAVVVHTDMRRTGWFECSDERVNRLHEAAVWSFRGNACDIPTDCPTRERQGWTGDWQLFAPVAAFLYDVAGFSTKWLRDLAAEQEPDGVVQNCAPDPQRIPGGSADNPFPPGSAGWGDAAVIVPWEMYRAYGDLRLLEDQWASMTAWVDYAATRAREGRHPDRVAARPEPAAHERFLWDTGAHWGEWLEPGEPVGDDIDEFLATHRPLDQGDVATAYLHHSAQIVGQVARVLGRTEDASRYDELAAHTLGAWRAEFIRDNRLVRDTQASYVRALAFGLAPEELRPAIRARLAELIRQAGTHLNTGFLATPYLLPVLADGGRADLAYELLLQDTEPSWLAMIDKGATTIWELWDAVGDDGVPTGSLNHYSKGAVISFLHRYVGGIRLGDEPAYRRFRVEPLPGGGITWARATHDAPYGRIEVAWRLEDGGFGLELTVPPGTVADVLLPDGRRFEAPPGRSAWERGGHAAVDVQ